MKSMTPNSAITAQARNALSGNWGRAIGVLFVYIFLMMGLGFSDTALGALFLPPESPVSLLQWIFGGPLIVGLAAFFICVLDDRARFSQMFNGFAHFGRSVASYFMYNLFILLWMLLLIIPGIIKSYSYAMTFYILADDSDVGPIQAITRSRELMDGNKWKYFRLQWRFFGWMLLCLLTLGIGFIWLGPYMNTSRAAFYQDVKEQA